MANLLKNASFENGVTQAYENWEGWWLVGGNAVCAYQKKVQNATTGFFQDIPGDSFTSDGTYTFQMKLLTPTDNASVKPTVWVFKKGQDAQPTQATFQLKKGDWQIVEVKVNITRSKLKKVRAELYFDPVDAEMIIQSAYFGK